MTLAIVFAVMELTGIDMQRISLGALIIALALLLDDAMTNIDAALTRLLAQGDDKVQAASFAFRTHAHSHAPTVFWGPIALAIMGGLLVATILTLVFLPTP